MVIFMYDAENVEFKFSRLRRHLKILLEYKVHSLSSGKVAATPILKSIPSQFSPFILEITVSLHAYKRILAQSRPQR